MDSLVKPSLLTTEYYDWYQVSDYISQKYNQFTEKQIKDYIAFRYIDDPLMNGEYSYFDIEDDPEDYDDPDGIRKLLIEEFGGESGQFQILVWW